jgi:proline iminopeptidase
VSGLYPEIEPYQHGMLDVGDGNRIDWEACGNPHGKPVVALHGGPGSGRGPRARRFFDPEVYRIVLFDQRGCGRSTPHASDPAVDLSTNTTWHIVGDIERLREALGIPRWMVFGGSWGSTLGLVYAETHPQRVTEIVLWGVALTRPEDIDWLYRGVAPLFPAQWARFARGVPEAQRTGGLLEAYYRLIHHPDPAVHLPAVRAFHDWEWALFDLTGETPPDERWLDPRFQLARGRIVTHYFHHRAWLDDGYILQHAGRLADIPGVMVHGRLDVGSPLVSAWELAQAWPAGELVVVPGAGHSTADPGMDTAIVAATQRFAGPPGDEFPRLKNSAG